MFNRKSDLYIREREKNLIISYLENRYFSIHGTHTTYKVSLPENLYATNHKNYEQRNWSSHRYIWTSINNSRNKWLF